VRHLGRHDGEAAGRQPPALLADDDVDLAGEDHEDLFGAVGVPAEPHAALELEVHGGGAARAGVAGQRPGGADHVRLVVAVVGGQQIELLGLDCVHGGGLLIRLTRCTTNMHARRLPVELFVTGQTFRLSSCPTK
jgi:hypothetical protein